MLGTAGTGEKEVGCLPVAQGFLFPSRGGQDAGQLSPGQGQFPLVLHFFQPGQTFLQQGKHPVALPRLAFQQQGLETARGSLQMHVVPFPQPGDDLHQGIARHVFEAGTPVFPQQFQQPRITVVRTSRHQRILEKSRLPETLVRSPDGAAAIMVVREHTEQERMEHGHEKRAGAGKYPVQITQGITGASCGTQQVPELGAQPHLA